jgi:hypothetical protein
MAHSIAQTLEGKDPSERRAIRERAHIDATTPTRWTTEEGVELRVTGKRYVEGRGLWVMLSSPQWATDPGGYYFVNPPTTHNGTEDVPAAFRAIATDAARYYHTLKGE